MQARAGPTCLCPAAAANHCYYLFFSSLSFSQLMIFPPPCYIYGPAVRQPGAGGVSARAPVYTAQRGRAPWSGSALGEFTTAVEISFKYIPTPKSGLGRGRKKNCSLTLCFISFVKGMFHGEKISSLLMESLIDGEKKTTRWSF
jgi:hypothetical protein